MKHLFLLILLLGATGCSSKPTEVIETRPAFGTTITIDVIGPTERSTKRVIAAGWAEMELCASHLDADRPDSDIARINAAAGGDPVPVDPLTATCLAAAREMWQTSGGAFDSTTGPLVDMWIQARAAGLEPGEDQIAMALALVGMDKVQIAGGFPLPTGIPMPKAGVQPMNSVRLPKVGMSLLLGDFVDGYCASRIAERMKQAGAVAGKVSVAGGPVVAFGKKPPNLVSAGGDSEWNMTVLDPQGESTFTCIRLRNCAAVTHGRTSDRIMSVVDPRTGTMIDTPFLATVVALDGGTAEALSRAVHAVGAKDGLAIVQKVPGAECLILEPVSPEVPGKPRLLVQQSSGFAALEAKPAATKS